MLKKAPKQPAELDQEVNHIDIAEFRRLGYLQEANRLFFHPLGLALEVAIMPDGTEYLRGVWDYRDDPEGMMFSEECALNAEAAERIAIELREKALRRLKRLGFVVQPIDYGKETDGPSNP